MVSDCTSNKVRQNWARCNQNRTKIEEIIAKWKTTIFGLVHLLILFHFAIFLIKTKTNSVVTDSDFELFPYGEQANVPLCPYYPNLVTEMTPLKS